MAIQTANKDLKCLQQVLINTDKHGKPLPRISSTKDGKYCSKSHTKTPFKALRHTEMDGIKQNLFPEVKSLFL